MGRIWSAVRVSVSFQQKYPPGSVLRCPTAAENGVMTKGVVSGEWGGGLAPLCLRRITSSPSQTLRPVTIRRRLSPGEVITIQAFLSTCMRPELCGCLKFQSSLSQQSQQIRLYWIRVNEQIYRIRILHTTVYKIHRLCIRGCIQLQRLSPRRRVRCVVCSSCIVHPINLSFVR